MFLNFSFILYGRTGIIILYHIAESESNR